MAAAPPIAPSTLTYKAYLAEGEVNKHYDILDGVRIVSRPSEAHQDCALDIAILFRQFGKASSVGKCLIAPADVLISRAPLRTRQLNILFISDKRRAHNHKPNEATPFDPAPELVVEIFSPSDTRQVLAEKLDDYQKVNVLECWAVRLQARTVEVLDLRGATVQSVAVYEKGESVTPLVFPGMSMDSDDIFAE